jgi:SAM-dependent methyltransferase
VVAGDVRGAAGYGGATAGTFHEASESFTFEDLHGQFLDLLPTPPGRALDAGAGTGRDAAALAAAGWDVDAVEPVADFIRRGQHAHPSDRIHWFRDALPHLPALRGKSDEYALVVVSTVRMHLAREERGDAMTTLSRLTASSGVMLLTLRHGPVPEGRWMDDVSGDETVGQGLTLLRRLDNQPSAMAGKPGVTWTRLAFVKR